MCEFRINNEKGNTKSRGKGAKVFKNVNLNKRSITNWKKLEVFFLEDGYRFVYEMLITIATLKR